MAKSINMVWEPHIARVKTKNMLNLRIGLFKAPLSNVEYYVLTIYGPHFCAPPPRLGGSGGTSETFLVFKAKSFLRTVTVSGAGVLCFPNTPIICLRVSHDIDAVIWVKNT